jgi:hypothetical protein
MMRVKASVRVRAYNGVSYVSSTGESGFSPARLRSVPQLWPLQLDFANGNKGPVPLHEDDNGPSVTGAVVFCFLSHRPVERGMTVMTLRRPEADGNTREEKSELPGSSSRNAMLTVRDALILSGSLAAGIAAGVLTYFAVRNLPEAVLGGAAACAAAVKFLDALIA